MRKNTNHGRGEAGGLPSGWVRAELGDVATLTSERVSPTDYPEAPYIGLEHVEAHTNRVLATVLASTMASGAVSFSAGDVLYGRMRPYLNKVVRPRFNGLASAEFIVFGESEALNQDFLLKRISANDFVQFACSQYEGDRPRVKFDQLRKFQLDLPPAAEQTRIVAKLEALLADLDAGVAELKAAQKKLVRYRQSLLKAAVEGALTAAWRAARSAPLSPRGRGAGGEGAAQGQHPLPNPSPVKGEGLECETGAQLLARILTERRARWEDRQRAKFAAQGKTPPKGWQAKYPEPVPPDTTGLPELPQGWVWASVEQLTEFITSGSRGWADYYADAGAMFIRSQNINKDWLDLSDVVRVNPPKGSEGARTRVQKDDVLLTITGANVGKAAQVEAAIDEAYVSQHVALIRPVDVAVSKVLHLFFTAEAGGRGQLNKEAYGAGKPGLNLQQVAGVCVPLASAAEFETLINIVKTQLDAATAKEVAIELALKQSTAQRQNLLRAAFAGELVPQDPGDEPASSLLARIRAERAAQGAASKPRGRKVKGAA